MNSTLTQVYVGIGSNLGNRLEHLKSAVFLFRQHGEVYKVESSPVYESDPVDHSDQPAYLNAALRIETNLDVYSFFRLSQEIEKENGRTRDEGKRWMARPLDIDILFWGSSVIQDKDLRIPHPEIENRSFVLVPLTDLDSEIRHPGTGELLKNRIESLPDKLSLHLFSDPL
ncbi:MAG: 2-amino-4-hydroxy-6-hydroxymethyldihydropteridine diphosphokinase [Bacteroidetes bacterium]|nr:2-amino-4-hydroxy-6-hydroxymethyldihydropteridine diphosphokinase [Bacteroidota bacterium]